MPMTTMPEGKIVCIGGDGGESDSPRNTKFRKMAEWLSRFGDTAAQFSKIIGIQTRPVTIRFS